MKKILTITGILLLSLTILLAGSAFVMSRFIDPNKFKGRISQLVYAKTGQVLVINGNMNWSILPWIGLKANDLTYYNAPSFSPKTFVSAQEMDIKVKLIPLITGNIEIGNITLNNATLNLVKNKSGKFNWQTVVKEDKKNVDQQNTSHSSTITNLSIASLKIKNGKLNWYDQQTNTHTIIDALNIQSKRIQFGKPFPLEIQFDLLNDHRDTTLSFDLDSDITLSPDYQQYALQNLKIKSQIYTKNNKLDFKANGNIAADLKKESSVADLNFSMNDIKGQLNLNGDQLNKKMHLSGTLSTENFSMKKLMQDLGHSLDTKNNDALKTVSILSKIDITDSNLTLTQLHAKIDKTDIFGNVNVASKNKNIRFNLNANQIDIDDYLSNKEDSAKPSSDTSVNAEQKVTARKNDNWDVNGVLKIASLSVDKLILSNIIATLDMKNDITKISPLRASLYKGELDGSVVIDQHQQGKTSIHIKQSVKNLDIKDLLHSVADSDKLSGKTDLNADLVSITDAKTSFLSALNGKINFALKNGSLAGIDIIYQLSRAHAFIKHLPSPSISDTKQTEFTSLTADAAVNNGVINTDNLALTSDYLKVNGKGQANLVNKEIHYRLNALAQPKLAKENTEIGKEITAYQVPIKVSGKLNKPSVNIDFVELAKNIFTKQIEKPISEHLGKNVNNLKDNLKEQVQDKIKEFSPSNFLNKLTKSKENESKSAAE